MKTKLYTLFTGLVLFSACKKNDTTGSGPMVSPQQELIRSAKTYFQNELLSVPNENKENQLAKTAIWDKAYTKKHRGQDVVLVPLKFSKAVNLKSNINSAMTLPGERQTRLLIYKDAAGRFRNAVYTSFPTHDYMTGKDKAFSGILMIQDWNGSNRRTYLAQSGKYRRLVETEGPAANMEKSKTAGRTCYWLEIYWCEDPELRIGCQLMQSIFIGCDRVGSTDELDEVDGYDESGSPLVETEEEYCAMPIGTVAAEKVGVKTCGQGDKTRTKCYTWKVFTVSGGRFLPMYLVSKEKGEQAQGPNDYYWRFTNFVHEKIEKEGTEILYSVSVESEKATPSIYSLDGVTAQMASMYVDFKVKISIICDGLPAAKNYPVETGMSWHVNE